MLGAGILTKGTHNSMCAVHKALVAAHARHCKTPSHTPSTVFYWLNKVNRCIILWGKDVWISNKISLNTYCYKIIKFPFFFQYLLKKLVKFLHKNTIDRQTNRPTNKQTKTGTPMHHFSHLDYLLWRLWLCILVKTHIYLQSMMKWHPKNKQKQNNTYRVFLLIII